MSKTTVTIQLEEVDNKHIKIAVKDEGPGLSDDDKKKLFRKYQRLSAKPTGGESSTGLGLSIVKKYVNMLQGRIFVESQLGIGTTFFIIIPKQPEVKKITFSDKTLDS